MTPTRKLTQAILSLTMILSMLLSLVQTRPAAAQEGDGIKREVNSETGKVSFIGPDAGKRSVPSRALGIAPSARGSSPAAVAMALAKRFAPEFGVDNPERDLAELRTRKQDNGRVSVHYQQNYQGIPVIGGEIIVNTNTDGDLYSMNGEAAQDLAVDTQPTISAEKAIEIAKQGMAKWYGGEAADYQQTEPSLWIFDEKLLRPSIRPVELVWRMDMTPAQPGQPIRELVLVNAKTGNISLHFNQVDTAWGGTQSQDPNPTDTPTPLPTEEVVPTETEAPVEVMPIGTPIPTETALSAVSTKSSESGRSITHPMAYTGATRYVASGGTDSGTCTSSSAPCAKIQYAINQSANGDVIKVADGTYYYPGASLNSTPNVVILKKGVMLSGGWQSGFSSQTGVSIIDGQNIGTGQKTYNGILVTAGIAAEVDRFIIQNSTSSDSGAIYHLGTSLTLRNSTLRNNTAGNRGAGIFVTNNAALTVINSTISGNTASQGAGIYVDSGTTNIEYSTIAYNTATNSGGGIYRGGGTLNVHNSILANNTNTTAPNCNILNTSGNNIINSITGCTVPAGTGNQLDVDPQIDASLTGTAAVHALLVGSPAINIGDLTSCNANTGNRDQRGVVRPAGEHCDIGAFEVEDLDPGVPTNVNYVSGSNQQTNINQAFSNPFVALVTDGYGDPVSGASVTFTAPASGASGKFTSTGTRTETVLTDSNGNATSSAFTANGTGGSYTATASTSGVGHQASYQLQNQYVPGVPQTITVTSGNNQGTLPNSAFANPFVVLVKDGYGTALSGIEVTFTAPGSGASGTFASNNSAIEMVTTNATGYATSSILTASSTSGTYTVSVSISGLESSTSITATNIGTRYVKTASNGGVDVGDCSSVATACTTISYAISQAFPGEVVKIAIGIYTGTGTEVVLVNKNTTLSAGWNADFTAQTGYSTIDGQSTRRGMTVNSGVTVVIERMAVQKGKATNGAGIYNNGILTLNNSTLTKNVSTTWGGALYSSNTSTLNNTTITGNSAYTGGGIYRYSGTITLKNTIVYGNTATLTPDCTGAIASGGYNLIGSTSGCTFTSSTGDLINVDPQLGEFIGYYFLQAGSPAIDAGNPAAPGSGGDACLATDQRGVSRPAGTRCDIGAYEYTAPGGITSLAILSGDGQAVPLSLPMINPLKVVALDSQGSPVPGVEVTFTAPESGPSGTFAGSGTQTTVTTDANGIATSPNYTANTLLGSYTVVASASSVPSINFSLRNFAWFVSPTGNDTNNCQTASTPCATIQAAVNKAAAGELIKVAGGMYTGSGLKVVDVTKNLTISGGWDSTYTIQNETSIIDGQNARRGITIQPNIIVTIENFTIQDGSYDSGGGIWSAGILTLNNSVIKNNTATWSSGGGLNLGSATNTVINNTVITGNSASRGGGISTSPNGVSRNGTVTINNSFIGNNQTDGVYLQSSSLNLNNTTIASNSGNGIYINVNAPTTIRNSTIAYNTGDGLSIYSGSGFSSVIVHNSILAYNPTGDCDGPLSISDHNIISNAANCNITTGTGNHLNVDAKLFDFSLGTPSYFPIKGDSPAFGGGNPDTCLATDQRGVSRPQQDICDIGAFEIRSTTNSPDRFGILNGNNQKVLPGDTLPTPFSVFALDNNGDAISGLTVTFTSPVNGASGSFANETNTTTVATDASGIATSSAFTTNTTIGAFTVSATASGVTSVFFQVLSPIWLVSPTGDGACIPSDPHCTTIQAAINNATANDMILVEKGTYLESVSIMKNIILQGGWNSTFTAQDGQTIIDGQKLRRNVTINKPMTVSIDHFDIRNGKVSNDLGGAGILNSGYLTFTNGAIYNNSAHHILYSDAVSRGGGIYSNGKALTLTNVTISNNEADTGGGIFVTTGVSPTDIGITTLNNVTITQNFATNLGATASGGGIENQNNSPITITNSIMAGNAAEEGQDCYGTITSGGYNLIGLNAGCTMTPAAGDQIGTQLEYLDVMLGDLKDNGGDTATHALLTGSPGIDAGNPATCAAMDQRSVARPQNSTCDIGAFEGSETQTVTANVKTYTAGNTQKWPGSFLCDSTTPDCTGGNDPSADYAHQYAIGTYNFYLTTHGRKGIDNNNMPIVSTVHYCGTSGCPYGNASWSGAQVVYGEGFSDADDSVAHEITHGVTQYESNLMYFYQSGAISESFSDLWGEYYDQINGLGTDTEAVKWEIGEDNSVWGAIRSMSDPTAYGDPDKMTSTLYMKTDTDSGGVHSNSGINNKAVFLMVDGGTFNGKTVVALGWLKTGIIYYEAQTNLLTSGSDYSDLYYTLQQACTNVVGQNGITSADCVQVKNALDAVQMNHQPVANFNPDTSLCPTGMTTTSSLNLLTDDFENRTGSLVNSGWWGYSTMYAAGGITSMWGSDEGTDSDSVLHTSTGIFLPPNSASFLYFKHAFAFEYDSKGYYDGAVLEYTKDGGTTWIDAKTLFSAGQNYKGIISPSYGNALAGRSGFVGDSHGYVSSRYNLSSLAGQTVYFRWRFATDADYWYWGWFIDDVKIYQCTGTPAIPALQAPLNNALITVYTPTLNWADASPALNHYQIQVATDAFIEDENIVLDQETTASEVTPTASLDPNQKYYWRVQAFNAINGTLGWSAVRTFRTAILPPTLTHPTNGDNSYNKRPTLTWETTSGASGYKVQIAKANNFGTVVVTGTTSTTSFTPLLDLLPNTTYYWHVQAAGLNGPSAWSETWSFTTGKPPAVPLLAAPASNALLLTDQPRLDWNNVTDPLLHHYQLQLATDSAFQNLVMPDQDTGTASEFTPSTPLDPNQTYYWRVRSYSASGDYSIWSPVRSFRTAMLPPTLTSPGNGDSLHNKRPTLQWNASSGASGYKIQIAKVNNFSTVIVNGTATTTSFTPTADLLPNTTYYWHVQATGLRGPSLWSETRSFTTGNPPTVPVLATPASNALLLTYRPKLDWNNVTGPLLHHYQLQLATDAAFQNLVVPEQDTGTVSEFIPATPLDPDKKYYWRVRSYSASGDYSAWSLVRTFRTAILPPTLTNPVNGRTIERLKPIFDWADVSGATGYTIQVSSSATFSTFLLNNNTVTSVYFSPKSLPVKKTLYWRVKANGLNGSSVWTTFNFRIEQ